MLFQRPLLYKETVLWTKEDCKIAPIIQAGIVDALHANAQFVSALSRV